MQYDPTKGFSNKDWQLLDDDGLAEFVGLFHAKNDCDVGESPEVHFLVHVVTERQIVDDSLPEVRMALQRLLEDGMDRHDAIHVLGDVGTDLMFELMNDLLRGDPGVVLRRRMHEIALSGLPAN